MTSQVDQIDQDQFEQDMIANKLTDVISTYEIAVPWETYSDVLDEIHHWLEDEYGIQQSISQLAKNQAILASFNTSVSRCLDGALDELCDYIDVDHLGETIFKAEIKEVQRIRAEKRKEEERLRLEAEQLMMKSMEVNRMNILVEKKHHNKALAILRAAGLVK